MNINKEVKNIIQEIKCTGVVQLTERTIEDLCDKVYNEALKDAVESAELNEYDEHMQFSPHLDDNSILKLKK